MDIISLLLGFVSILQNIGTKKSLEEKVTVLSEAIEEGNEIYSLLMLAKTYHDAYDRFQSTAMRPLIESNSRRNQMSNQECEDHANTFLNHFEHSISDNTLPALSEIKPPPSKRRSELPANVYNSLEMIIAVYPKLVKSHGKFNDQIAIIQSAVREESYGKSYDGAIVMADHFCVRSLTAADQLVMHSSQVVSFIHYRIGEAVKSLVPQNLL